MAPLEAPRGASKPETTDLYCTSEAAIYREAFINVTGVSDLMRNQNHDRMEKTHPISLSFISYSYLVS